MDKYFWNYKTPDGFTDMIMFSDGRFLTGLVFKKSSDGFTNRWGKTRKVGTAFSMTSASEESGHEELSEEHITENRLLPVFEDTILWLDQYFGKDPETGKFTGSGLHPDFVPSMKIEGITPFRRKVIAAMLSIPYGQTMTYGEIAKMCGKEKMSARAVGGAVGWNPICLIIPCHRVLGANGLITGYGGGIQNKIALLQHESIML